MSELYRKFSGLSPQLLVVTLLINEVNHKCANMVEPDYIFSVGPERANARNWILCLRVLILVEIPVELLVLTSRKRFEIP